MNSYFNSILLGLSLMAPQIGFSFQQRSQMAQSQRATKVSPIANYSDWPAIQSSIVKDPAMELEIQRMLSEMSLEQKIGQMTQAEIKSITPAEVSEFYIGSILNGGGSWPNNNKHASVMDWVQLADRYYEASMKTKMKTQIPILWGTDAVHGHNNVYGATIFPHNIGLGATRDANLIESIGGAVGTAVRATGINWVFAPTLAVVRDDRWGRTYESFSEDPSIVREFAGRYIRGLQGTFASESNVIATAKHFIGDGGTNDGVDQGENRSTLLEMINIHGQGYYSALSAGVQTVMASFNSWNDVGAKNNVGKMHGSHHMLTEVLKVKMGFDGFVVSDWNGISQVPGCTNSSCAQAINAGVDLVMVPEDWKAFISETIQQVKNGQISMSRIDDAVARLLRVKMRAGLFKGKKPSQNAFAGKPEALLAKTLARRAVQESIVLLKNKNSILPLSRNQRILVVGKSASSFSQQTGGWTLTWQGTENTNDDFITGNTLLSAIQSVCTNSSTNLGTNLSKNVGTSLRTSLSSNLKTTTIEKSNITYSETGLDLEIDAKNFDVIIASLGESPYAEGAGDLKGDKGLDYSLRSPEDLKLVQRVSGHGVPVVTILYSGRALYVNPILALSDAFVAAWLPGTEALGITDVIFQNEKGAVNLDFQGTLSFSWPRSPNQNNLNSGATPYEPLFELGYGLKYDNDKR